MTIPQLETQRLKLRAFSQADWEPYAEMCADEAFVRFLSGNPLSRKQAWEQMALILGHWQLHGYGIWALECKSSGQLVGRAGLLNLPGWPDVEVGWALAPRFWGNGFATEAGRAAVDWAFQAAGLKRVISLIHPDNHASEAVARRLGATLCEHISLEGRPRNVFEIIYAAQN